MADLPSRHAPLAVAQAMLGRDRASQLLGLNLENCAAGTATVSMQVRDDMVNGLSVCHGGFIFTLADSAFAFACNSYNFNTVAAGCSIEFLAPGKLGDTLTARATERAQRGRSGVYDIDVFNQNHELIAVMRGKSARVPGQVIAEE
jgi:acyl-CoA thioesterase